MKVSHFPDSRLIRVSCETVIGEARVRWARAKITRLRMRTMVKIRWAWWKVRIEVWSRVEIKCRLVFVVLWSKVIDLSTSGRQASVFI